MARPPIDAPKPRRRRRPATTPEERENQMVSLALDVAEQQMLNGTASAQVVVHYLKLGTMRERMEQDKLKGENELLRAKVEQLSANSRTDESLDRVLNALRGYQGEDVELPDEF